MLGNWIKETTTTSGTGNITLAGAATGFATFDAQFPNATLQYFYYLLEDGNNREYGIGHLTASTTLVRDRVLAKLVSGTYTRYSGSGAGTPITLSGGTAYVYCDIGAEWGGGPGFEDDTTTGVCNLGECTEYTTNAAITQDFQYYTPIKPVVSGLYSGINLHYQTAAGDVKSGIYDVGVNGLPDRLLASHSTGTTITTGNVTLSFSANVFLQARRWYFFSVLQSGSCNMLRVLYGNVTGGTLKKGSDGTQAGYAYISRSYSSGLLSPHTGTLTYIYTPWAIASLVRA
jgi:hypothetical protein